LGQEDRDWYWWRRARRNSAADDYLFPDHHWRARRSTVFPTALAVLAVLVLLVFALNQGWFDRDWRLHAAKVQAEIAAERAWESERHMSTPPPRVAPLREVPQVPAFHERHRLAIEFALLGSMILSPFVLLGLLSCLFSHRLRGPALVGLVLGVAAANGGGTLYTRGWWFRWGLLYPADSMGGTFQFLEVITAAFTVAAIVGAIAMLVFVKSGPQSSSTRLSRERDDIRGDLTNGGT